jgi:hypothetical protein
MSVGEELVIQYIAVFKARFASHLGHRFCTEVEGVVEQKSRDYNDFTMGGPIPRTPKNVHIGPLELGVISAPDQATSTYIPPPGHFLQRPASHTKRTLSSRGLE